MNRINKILDKYLESENPLHQEKMLAATRIRTWLLAIDLDSEVIPTRNLDMLSRLLHSLKGEKLNSSEWDLVLEIVYQDQMKENQK